MQQMNVRGEFVHVEGQDALWLTVQNCVPIEAAGESFNQDHIERIVDRCGGRMGVPLVTWLMPEPQNPHDPNAVLLWIFGGKVGYLPRDLAAIWNPAFMQLGMRAQRQLACASHLRLPRHDEQGFQVVTWLPRLPTQDQPSVELGDIPIVMLKAEEVRLSRDRKKAELERKAERAAARRAKKLEAFDETITAAIEANKVWRGQTLEQLELSCGKPDRMQEKVLKTKTKHMFEYESIFGVGPRCEKCEGRGSLPQYRHIGGGVCFRCGGTGTETGWVLRVNLDNGVVVGWEDKRPR